MIVSGHTSGPEARATGSAPGSSLDLAPGTQIGDYRIERKLGAGGMGSVYEAVHQIIDRRVALKVLHHDLSEDGDAVHRFVREARAANRIRDPGIVDVFGFGKTPDGRAFLAMELLEGESLRERLAGEPRLALATTCHILLAVARALAAAHAAGIVHRDLKPDNVFLVADGEIKLLDFGIAKLSTPTGISGNVEMTQPGVLIGTPQYIAPEQARGLTTTPSADVYSLGVLAFEMVTGRPPFVASDPLELLAKHITLRAPAPSELDPALPPSIDGLIGAMLAKDPESRPRSEDVVAALAAIARQASSYDRFARGGPIARPVDADTQLLDVPSPPRSALRTLGMLAGGLMFVAGIVRGAVWWGDRGAEPPRPAGDDLARVADRVADPRSTGTADTPEIAAPAAPVPTIEMPPDDIGVSRRAHAKPSVKPPAKRAGATGAAAAAGAGSANHPAVDDDDAIRDPYRH